MEGGREEGRDTECIICKCSQITIGLDYEGVALGSLL